MKDLTLVAGIKDWTDDSKSRTVREFFAQFDTYAKVSNWSEDEKALITNAKLQRIVLDFKLSPCFEYCMCSFGYNLTLGKYPKEHIQYRELHCSLCKEERY
jgi:hypothetical protein